MKQRGFTLLEVMVALAILAGGLVIVIQSAASNMATTQAMSRMGIAVELTRSKMYYMEERLLDPLHGYKETDEEIDGDFADEGHKDIKWAAKIEKIELPGLPAIEQLAGGGEEGAEEPSNEDAGGAPGLSMLGGLGGGSAMFGLIFEQVKKVLEQGIRKVTVTVTYDVVTGEDELVTVCFFTDPAAVTRAVGGFGAPDPNTPKGPVP